MDKYNNGYSIVSAKLNNLSLLPNKTDIDREVLARKLRKLADEIEYSSTWAEIRDLIIHRSFIL